MTPQTSGKGCLGARVGLREVDSVPEKLQVLAGTITRSFGHPDPAAHDVLLDGGAPSELFWHYQLKEEAPPSGRSGNAGRRPFTEVLGRGGLLTLRTLNPNSEN